MTELDPDAAQAAIEHCYEQGWSDGLPLVPASRPLVERFLATAPRQADEVIGVLPITGVPLPFISFGGSSLLATMAGAGILLNVARTAPGFSR